ncbi:MAG: alpha-galactosidase [Kiritimatiellae bacterium]|nr:alpha-galactosidase [Kiritimatiellia bacterium]
MTFRFDVEKPPFSFRLGGAHSNDLPGKWRKRESRVASPGGHTETFSFADAASNLEVTASVRRFDSMDAVDWVLEFRNVGQGDTPIISEVNALDWARSVPAGAQVLLHHAHGSECAMDDFVPRTDAINHGAKEIRLGPKGGRSSDGEMPFMNLATADGGLVLAVGWTGQWEAGLVRTADQVSIRAGMDRTHLFLKPGEHFRTPRILTINYQGSDWIVGNNLLRKIMLAYYTPRPNGELAVPPTAHMTMSSYHKTQRVSLENELQALAKAAELGLEAYWVDACWYGTGKEWWKEVGNWNIRKEVFPEGLKPIGDAAHKAGMKFILWFEPERVRLETKIAADHPEYLLRLPVEVEPHNALLNLGIPEAREYITNEMDKIIVESGVDVYRQDFNFGPLAYWNHADAPDRIGWTQAKHIEGLYAMWDELLRRHPGMTIDNCASGGRRIDLETCSRSYPLWRSDFSDAGGPSWGMGLQIGDQCQTAGLSPWVPLHEAAVWSFSPYAFRSAMSTGVVIYCSILDDDFPAADAKQALAELRSLRPYMLGDFYPQVPLTAAYHDWCAYQYHRPEEGDGFAVFLRRHESPFTAVKAALKGIDENADYWVSLSESFAESPERPMRGRMLTDLTVEISDKPGSVLVRYRKRCVAGART